MTEEMRIKNLFYFDNEEGYDPELLPYILQSGVKYKR